jgi:hypothetical protein
MVSACRAHEARVTDGLDQSMASAVAHEARDDASSGPMLSGLAPMDFEPACANPCLNSGRKVPSSGRAGSASSPRAGPACVWHRRRGEAGSGRPTSSPAVPMAWEASANPSPSWRALAVVAGLGDDDPSRSFASVSAAGRCYPVVESAKTRIPPPYAAFTRLLGLGYEDGPAGTALQRRRHTRPSHSHRSLTRPVGPAPPYSSVTA